LKIIYVDSFRLKIKLKCAEIVIELEKLLEAIGEMEKRESEDCEHVVMIMEEFKI
jgi:hypothetical protein